MARTRNIKPSFFKNEDLAKLSPLTRLLFIGLWTQADREGRLEDRPKRLKAEILPFDRYRIEEGLSALVDGQFIDRYRTVDGLSVIQVRKFSIHQSPHPREEASVLPKWDGSIPDAGADSKEKKVMHESSMTHASRKPKPSKRRASTMHESSMESQTTVSSPLALTLTSNSDESTPPNPPSTPNDPLAGFYAPDGAGEDRPSPPKSKGAALIDLIRAGGVEPIMTGRDFASLKACSADVALIAEAYLAAHAGTWNPGGRGWLRDNLSVHAVIERLAGYVASKSNITPIRPTGYRHPSEKPTTTTMRQQYWADRNAREKAETEAVVAIAEGEGVSLDEAERLYRERSGIAS